jgi:hypothetical protein
MAWSLLARETGPQTRLGDVSPCDFAASGRALLFCLTETVPTRRDVKPESPRAKPGTWTATG